VAAGALLVSAGCGIVGPSCVDETGTLLHETASVSSAGVSAFVVTSPKSSNLRMRLTWPDTDATLAFSATITDCGVHVGCVTDTVRPPFGPGGSSPVPQAWPPGVREMLVDGSRGKTYRIEIAGDAARAATFTLDVTYEIRCEK
jgi:hypothetical protein